MEIQMPLPDDLEKLNALHERGALTNEEFVLAKKRLLEGTPDEHESLSALRRLRRSINDRWIGGVCGGLGELSGVPSWTWRILFVPAALLHGLGLLVYILLWIFVPARLTPSVSASDPAPPAG